MLKAPEVARMLGISARAVYDLADAGMLPCFRMGVGGGAVRFDVADVEAHRAAARRSAGNPGPDAADDRRGLRGGVSYEHKALAR